MQAFLRESSRYQVGVPVIAANSEVFHVGDPLSIQSGFIEYAEAGEKVIGYCLENYTAASDNQTVAKYKIQYVKALGVEMIFSSDQAAAQTDVGLYADLVGTTGATQINLAGGSTGQFQVLGFDPLGTGDTSLVVVEIAEPQFLAFAQA